MLGLKFLPNEGAVAFQAVEMDLFIVADTVLPKPPEQLEPAFAQATQGAGVAVDLRTFGLVISLRPGALFAARVGPQMNGVAQKLITRPADMGFADLTRLITDGADPGLAQQALRIGEALPRAAQARQQPRPQRLFSAGQGAKNVVIGMGGESLCNPAPIFLDLVLERFEHAHQALSQQAFGCKHRRTRVEGLALRPGGQPLRCGLGPPQLMAMQKFFPLPFAGGLQGAGSGKLFDPGPGEGLGPVLKAFQGQRIIVGQGRLELVDQGRALLDEADLVTTKQTQGAGGLVLGSQGSPSLTVGPQGIGQTPGIVAIGFGAAGHFAFAVTFGLWG